MAEINNSLALYTKNPEIDFTTPLLTAAKLKAADDQSALTALTIKDRGDKQNALADYSARAKAGDPKAADALISHPETYAQVIGIRNSIAEADRKTYDDNLMRNARGAQRVMGIADPAEKAAAWKEELDTAVKERRIDPNTYKRLAGTPPNELVLSNIMRAGLSLEQAITLDQKDKTRLADSKAAGVFGGKTAAGDDEETPAAAARAPVGATPKVWGDAEATAAGLYPASPAATPAAVVNPVLGTTPAAAAVPAKPGTKKKPDDLAAIVSAAASSDISPSTRAVGMEILKNRLGQDKTKISDDIAQREEEIKNRGMDAKSPQNQQYILTGKFPREDAQPLTSTDKKAIMEADEHVMTTLGVIDNLKAAKTLSADAFEGPMAGMRGYVASLVGNKGGEKTQELDNVVTANALAQLKATFGAAPTEGERKILLEIQGSVGKTDAVRQKIYDRAIALAERRLEMNQSRANELRGGEFYKKKSGAAPATAAKPGEAPAAPAAIAPADTVPALPPGFQLVPAKRADAGDEALSATG